MTEQERMFQEILMRRRREKHAKEKEAKALTNKASKEIIYEMYVVKNMTTKEIVKELKISASSLYKLIDHYGIERRVKPKEEKIYTLNDFVKYLHTIFTTNLQLTQINSVTYVINGRYKFEWHDDFVKSTKRILDVRENTCEFTIKFNEWSNFKIKDKYIAQCLLTGEILRLFRGYNQIPEYTDFSASDIHAAVKRRGTAGGYVWKIVDINGNEIN